MKELELPAKFVTQLWLPHHSASHAIKHRKKEAHVQSKRLPKENEKYYEVVTYGALEESCVT
jgi:hypothetical protein